MSKTPITDPRDMTIAILFELLRKTSTGRDFFSGGDGDSNFARYVDQADDAIDREEWLSYHAIESLHDCYLTQRGRAQRRKVKRQEALVKAVRKKLTREEFDAVRNADPDDE